MRRLPWLIAVVLMSAGAECTEPKGEVEGTRDGDADADADADADSDADSDADTDADVDTGASGTYIPDTVECDEAYNTPAPADCLTGTIACGETVYANNAGGSTLFEADGQFEQCSGTATGDDFGGPERVYKFVAPAGVTSVQIQLDSCRRSWLLWYQGGPECPAENQLQSCSYPPDYGNTFNSQGESVIVGPSGEIIFVVEGFQNSGGNFALTLDCY